jgi:tubulin---tyrosine ligase
VKVVVPNSQKSWISSAYEITRTIEGCYYYPRDPGQSAAQAQGRTRCVNSSAATDGTGESSPTSRPLKEGEVGEWILLNGVRECSPIITIHSSS